MDRLEWYFGFAILVLAAVLCIRYLCMAFAMPKIMRGRIEAYEEVLFIEPRDADTSWITFQDMDGDRHRVIVPLGIEKANEVYLPFTWQMIEAIPGDRL